MGGLTREAVSAKIQVRPLSITVSTTGFHPVNAGSTPAEVTIVSELLPSGAFLLVITEYRGAQIGRSTFFGLEVNMKAVWKHELLKGLFGF